MLDFHCCELPMDNLRGARQSSIHLNYAGGPLSVAVAGFAGGPAGAGAAAARHWKVSSTQPSPCAPPEPGSLFLQSVEETALKTFRTLGCVAMLLAAASPALAADQIFQHAEGELILDAFDGRPFWELQAYCAGYHGATANHLARLGDNAQASAAEAAGVAAFDDAVRQIRHDRGIDANAATKVAEPVVQIGGRVTAQSLRQDGMAPTGRWNYWRSFCIDAKVAFNRASH
jgi:hypothetical protein